VFYFRTLTHEFYHVIIRLNFIEILIYLDARNHKKKFFAKDFFFHLITFLLINVQDSGGNFVHLLKFQSDNGEYGITKIERNSKF